MSVDDSAINRQNLEEDARVLIDLKELCLALQIAGVTVSDVASMASLPYATVKQILTRVPEKPRLNLNFRRAAVAALKLTKDFEHALKSVGNWQATQLNVQSLSAFLNEGTLVDRPNTLARLVCETFQGSALGSDEISLPRAYYVLRQLAVGAAFAVNIMHIESENGEYVFYQTHMGRTNNSFSYGRVVSGLSNITLLCNIFGLMPSNKLVDDAELKSHILIGDTSYIMTDNVMGLEFYSFSRLSLARPSFFVGHSGVGGRGDPTYGQLLFINAEYESPLSLLIGKWLKEDFGDAPPPHGILIVKNEDELTQTKRLWPTNGELLPHNELNAKSKSALISRWASLEIACGVQLASINSRFVD
jgi:hypothetical protein